jgi:hypothetical protein
MQCLYEIPLIKVSYIIFSLGCRKSTSIFVMQMVVEIDIYISNGHFSFF